MKWTAVFFNRVKLFDFGTELNCWTGSVFLFWDFMLENTDWIFEFSGRDWLLWCLCCFMLSMIFFKTLTWTKENRQWYYVVCILVCFWLSIFMDFKKSFLFYMLWFWTLMCSWQNKEILTHTQTKYWSNWRPKHSQTDCPSARAQTQRVNLTNQTFFLMSVICCYNSYYKWCPCGLLLLTPVH